MERFGGGGGHRNLRAASGRAKPRDHGRPGLPARSARQGARRRSAGSGQPDHARRRTAADPRAQGGPAGPPTTGRRSLRPRRSGGARSPRSHTVTAAAPAIPTSVTSSVTSKPKVATSGAPPMLPITSATASAAENREKALPRSASPLLRDSSTSIGVI